MIVDPDYEGELKEIIKTLSTWEQALEQTRNKLLLVTSPLMHCRSCTTQKYLEEIDRKLISLHENQIQLKSLTDSITNLVQILERFEYE